MFFCPGVYMSSSWCVCVLGGLSRSVFVLCVWRRCLELRTESLWGLCSAVSGYSWQPLAWGCLSLCVCVCMVLGLRGLSLRSAGSCVSCGLRVYSVYVSHVRPVFSVGALDVRAARAVKD